VTAGHLTGGESRERTGSPRKEIDMSDPTDASIIPEAPSATTNMTVIMLAEHIYQRAYAS
jgi:choline dehydrogenase